MAIQLTSKYVEFFQSSPSVYPNVGERRRLMPISMSKAGTITRSGLVGICLRSGSEHGDDGVPDLRGRHFAVPARGEEALHCGLDAGSLSLMPEVT